MEETELKTKAIGDAYYDGVLKRYDLSREEIQKLANIYIAESKGKTCVYYRFTCSNPECGSRCGFNEPNILYEVGVCSNCEKETVITEAGFMVVTTFTPKQQKQPATHVTKPKRTRKKKETKELI